MVAPGGAILTGGGALMPGMEAAASQILGVSVRRGVPHPDLVEVDEAWLSPAYSTALGLLYYSTTPRWAGVDARTVARKRPLWMRKLVLAVEDIFK